MKGLEVYMDLYEVINDRLNSGASEETIVKEFTDSLNRAKRKARENKVYAAAIDKLRDAWNDAVDAYAVYKGLPEGTTAEELYLKENDDIIDGMLSTYSLVKDYASTLSDISGEL